MSARRQLQTAPRAGKGQSVVYVLELQDGCFYVGKTDDFERRMEEHRRGLGSRWTQRHAFVRCCHREEVPAAHSSGLETKTTASEMLDKGVNCVRGAGLCHDRDYTLADMELLVGPIGHALELNFDTVRTLIRPELERASVATASNGAAPREVGFQWECNYCPQSFPTAAILDHHTTDCLRRVYGRECFRCLRRDGHWAADCNHTVDVYGEIIEDVGESEEEYEDDDDDDDDDDEEEEGGPPQAAWGGPLQGNAGGGCFRCGRHSHWAQDCFASTHIDGSRLD